MVKKKLLAGILIGLGIVIPSVIFLFISTEPKSFLENPTFDSPIEPTWFSSEEGDLSDVEATTSEGQINFRVLGESYQFELIENPPVNETWTAVKNTAFPTEPNLYLINSGGCYVYHYWNEDEKQSPSIHWDKNITMPVDMLDYEITSASITAVVNATVHANNGVNAGVEAINDLTDNGNTQYANYDYVRFYVLISDLEKSTVHELAYYQSTDLGNDSAGLYDYLYDTQMSSVSMESLIFYLSQVLRTDNRHFTITLGIRIWCEDNWANDDDIWDALYIKSFNLNFTYKKIIDQLTTVSWNQIGNKISGENIQITGATINFKYKTDKSWISSAPLSEIRILINNKKYSETIKLSSATNSFQEARSGGFDISSIISKDVEISLSIQLFLADTFRLDEIITISIDDVYLIIDIIEVGNDYTPHIIGLTSALAGIVTIFTLYEKHFKYPPLVRRVRKLRQQIHKKKIIEPILIKEREEIIKKSFTDRIKILELELIQEEER